MTTRRTFLIAVGAGAWAAPFASFAQQQGKVRRIGFLAVRFRSTPANPEVYYDAFVQGMRDLGYVEGKNLVIEWRFADGKLERVPDFAAEIVRAKVEVIVTHGTQATQVAQRATSTIPIVTAAVGDPVGSGFAASLARPGGNITGLSTITTDVTGKQIEFLKAMMPKLSRLAFLVNPTNPGSADYVKNAQGISRQLGLKIQVQEARDAGEIERGFAAMTQARAEALIVSADAFLLGQRRQLADLTRKHRLPSMFYYREDAQAGGLISYGQNLAEHYRRAATFVDKILKGANPGELPFEQPTKIHLAINLKTAKALGLTISKEFLFRADELFE